MAPPSPFFAAARPRQGRPGPSWAAIGAGVLLAALLSPSPVLGHHPKPARVAGEALGFTTLDDQIIYFVMVDRFANGDASNDRPTSPDPRGAFHGGDLVGLRDRLDYLADLGVTAIWISPVARQVDGTVSGVGFPDAAYHGYWPEDLAGVDPRFGDEAALKALIDEAHARGIRVVLDVVINHVGYGSRLAARANLIRSGADCPSPDDATDTTRCLFGLPDFKTERPEVRAYVVDKTAAWVRNTGVDGFRLDALKHVEPALILELRDEVNPLRKGQPFLFLGEDWGAGPSPDAIPAAVLDGRADNLIDFSFHGLVEGFLNGRMRAEALAHHLEARHRAKGPVMAHFLDSHDVTSLLARLPAHARARYPLAAALQMTVRGMPLITWGDEVGRVGGDWPHNRADMPWSSLTEPAVARTLAQWRALIALRRQAPAMRGSAFMTVLAETEPAGAATLVYQRGSGAETHLVALRRGPGATRDLVLPAAPGAKGWCLAWSSTASALLWQPTQVEDPMTLSLPPDAAVILQACPP